MDPKLLSRGPAAIDNVYHIGCVVPDLPVAMDTLGRRFQITWAPPFQMNTGFTTPDGAADDRVTRFAFSTEGPPFIELIEVIPEPDSIFFKPADSGIHHVAVWAKQWRQEVARLTDEGMQLERIGAGAAFVRDPDTGFRMEIISFNGRGFLDRILSGEMAKDYPLT